jgi:hypothetical protein
MAESTLPRIAKAWLRAIDRAREMDWIAQHQQQYLGRWVALDGDRLIGHSDDPRPLVEKARSEGVERPLIVHLQEEPTAYTGGWL